MANYFLVADPNHKCREKTVREAADRLHVADGLTEGHTSPASVSVIWAAAPSAPVDAYRSSEGLCTVWGDALREEPTVEGGRATAVGVLSTTSADALRRSSTATGVGGDRHE